MKIIYVALKTIKELKSKRKDMKIQNKRKIKKMKY